jgi:hypothetical protein
MSADHILDTVMRAGIWRAMHGVSPLAAAVIAAACVEAALALRRRR